MKRLTLGTALAASLLLGGMQSASATTILAIDLAPGTAGVQNTRDASTAVAGVITGTMVAYSTGGDDIDILSASVRISSTDAVLASMSAPAMRAGAAFVANGAYSDAFAFPALIPAGGALTGSGDGDTAALSAEYGIIDQDFVTPPPLVKLPIGLANALELFRFDILVDAAGGPSSIIDFSLAASLLGIGPNLPVFVGSTSFPNNAAPITLQNATITNANAVPAPATLALIGVAVLGFAWTNRRSTHLA